MNTPWFEILTEDEKPIKRFNCFLSDPIEINYELMEVPSISLTLPMEFYEYLSLGRKKMRLHFGDISILTVVDGIDTNTENQTIDVTLNHVIKTWNYKQCSTNLAIKFKTFYELYTDESYKKEFIYEDGWNLNFDEDTKKEIIDYVYSRLGKLDVLTQTCEYTPESFWRICLSEEKRIDIGKFGEDTPYFLSKLPSGKRNIQLLSEPTIREDYSSVINQATVYSEKNDGGVTSLSLREVYNNKELQIDGFPVVIIANNINNERDYDYGDNPKIAPNEQLEYAVLDQESIAIESGVFMEGSFAFNDLSPFTTEEATEDADAVSVDWVIPTEQRYLTEDEMYNNFHAFYQYFKGKWSDNAISAICGVMAVESTGNPNIWQGLDPNSNPINREGFGLLQWTPYTNITNWLNSKGYQVEQYGIAECKKIEEEWTQNATNGPWIPTTTYNCTFNEWSQFTDKDMSWMVLCYLADYGRGDTSINLQYQHRIDVANTVLSKIQNEWKSEDSGSKKDTDDNTSESTGTYNPQNVINTYDGKSIDVDGFPPNAPYQCVDLWRKVMMDYGNDIGIITGDGYAYNIWNMDYSAKMMKISADETPIFGDWAVFGMGGQTPYSHIAMVVQDNEDGTISVFGQNQGASYCNIVTLSSSSILGYWRFKPEYWDKNAGGYKDIGGEPNDNTKKVISDEDRIYASKTVYDAVVKKLKNARRTYAIEVTTTELPKDLEVGMKIRLMYDNSIYKLEHCGNYMKKLLTLNNDFYITKLGRKFYGDGSQTGTLTLEKFVKIDREVHKE